MTVDPNPHSRSYQLTMQPSDVLPAVTSLKEEQQDICVTKSEPLYEEHNGFDITATSVFLNLDLKHEVTVKEEKCEEEVETDFLNTSSAPQIIIKTVEGPVDGEHEILLLKECKAKSQGRPACRTLRYTKIKKQLVSIPVPELKNDPDDDDDDDDDDDNISNENDEFVKDEHNSHSSPRGTVCTLCGRTFAKSYIHMRMHTGLRPYRCQTCGADFFRSDRLKEHMTTHNSSRSKAKKKKRPGIGMPPCNSCSECGKSFRNPSTLQAHMLGHAQLRSHTCNMCDARFIHISDLRRHMRGHLRPYPCDKCGQRFRRADTLRKHLPVHTGERRFRCVPCGKTYRHQESLRQHLKLHKQH